MLKKIMKLKDSKLNRKLLKKMSIIFIVIIAYIAILTSKNIKEIETRRLDDINNLLVESYTKESNNLINKAFENGEIISSQIEELLKSDNLDTENIERIIEPALLFQKNIKGIYVQIEKNDTVVNPYWFRENNQIKTEIVNEPSSPSYWDPIVDHDRSFVKPTIYNVGGEDILLTTLEIPIKVNGEMVGLVGMDLSMDYFESLANSSQSIDGIEISIISYEGMIISHANNNLVGTSIYDQNEVFKKMNIDEIIKYKSEELDDAYLLNSRFNMGIIDQQWYLMATIPNSLIHTIASEMSIRIGAIGFIGLIVTIVLTSMTVNRTLSPIHEVCETLEYAYKGDLSVRTVIESGDEIENIANGLNDLLSSLEENEKDLKNEVNINKELNFELEESMKDNDRIYFDTIKSLVNTIEAKDLYTGGHCDRVTNYSLMIGTEIGLTRKEMINLDYGARLHDIGKIAISENILCKVERLSSDEFNQIKQHPKKGFEIIKDIHFLKNSKDVIIHHHERFDGGGYPDGLKGNDINILSRIVSIADAYDAMTSSRSYRSALSKEAAMSELINNRGSQFDPELVDVFVRLLENEVLM